MNTSARAKGQNDEGDAALDGRVRPALKRTLPPDAIRYLDLLKQRKAASKVYSEHQLTGLLLAEILSDRAHKSLYMKLAKRYPKAALMGLSRSVASRTNVANRGAYFMKVIAAELTPEERKKIFGK